MRDKLLDNFAQLLILAVITPLLFALITPTARASSDDMTEGKVYTEFLKIFDEDEYYQMLSGSIELVVAEVQYEIDRIDGLTEQEKSEKKTEDTGKSKDSDKKKDTKTDKGKTDSSKDSKTEKGQEKEKTETKKLYGERRADTEKALTNKDGLAGALFTLLAGAALKSLLGGLLIMLCFNMWKPITEWADVCGGIWPVVPAALCAYIGCYLNTLEEKDLFVRNMIYLLAVANFSFVLLKSQYHRTAVVWQLVKGVISAIIACGIAAGGASIFCIYTMLEKDTIGGKSAYLALFGISLITGILIAAEDKVIDSAERFDVYE